MGVPKFFRWLSERYPLINQVVESSSFPPEFDNFYLDMNGIIHHCTHPMDEDNVAIQLTEKEMLLTIIHYIDKLFHMIKPKKLLYLAIDGVAPRAKMNQQRQRRFRSAKDQKEAVAAAKEKGADVPENPFDSNCITPGTEFMINLSHALRFFIKKKIQEDTLWRRCQVIFSGCEVPGEGEHKIIEYIRHLKSQSHWDPNTRHCLYGLDADLIMLSLTTHEPHFALLREDVLSKTKKVSKASDFSGTRFHLLHIGLLREYLDEDLHVESLPFQYDLERVIDDFVLMCFFVGNDFLPNLPYWDIADNALNNMFIYYKELLPKMGGYLTEGPVINFERLEMFISKIAAHEKQQFEFVDFDLDKTGGLKSELDEEDQKAFRKRSMELKKKKFENDMQSIGALTSSADDEDDSWKEMYYKEKFGITLNDQKYISDLKSAYIHGLSWVLNYYHDGCVSWGWYFPFHFGPLASDLKDLKSLKISFDLGKPFLPFQQLLAVLPRESSNFLPPAYKKLMNDGASPIIDYYPTEFTIDMNGKKNAWEGVVIIPFIDETRLLNAIKNTDSSLTPIEKSRNQYGPVLTYTYDSMKKYYCKSPVPEFMGDILDCTVAEIEFTLPVFPSGKHEGFRLCKGVLLGGWAPACFPTLHALEFESAAEYVHINVFGGPSRKDSIVLHILPPKEPNESIEHARSSLGKVCYVGYPYFKEAIVDSCSDGFSTYYPEKRIPHSVETASQWRKETQYIQNTQYGTKALDIGDIRVLLHVRVLDKMTESMDGSKQKIYHTIQELVPLQLTVQKLNVVDTRSNEVGARPLLEILPPDQEFVYLGQPQYGSKGKIVQLEANRSVTISIMVDPPIPTFGRYLASQYREKYYPLYTVSRMMNLSPKTLSKITASVFFQPGKLNVGLSIKFSGKAQQVLGYSRSVPKPQKSNQNNYYNNRGPQNQWEFSDKAIKLIGEYYQKFPRIFELLEAYPEENYYNIDDLLYDDEAPAVPPHTAPVQKQDYAPLDKEEPAKFDGNGEEGEDEEASDESILGQKDNKAVAYIKEVRNWLKGIEPRKLPKVPIGSESLSAEAVAEMEKESNKFAALTAKQQKSKILKGVDPYLLLKPVAALPEEFHHEVNYALGDRVTVVSDSEAVPFGSMGTIIGVKGQAAEVLMDQQYMGASNLEKRCSDLRGATLMMSSLLNLSQPYTPQELLQTTTRKKLRSTAEGILTSPVARKPRMPDEEYSYIHNKPEHEPHQQAPVQSQPAQSQVQPQSANPQSYQSHPQSSHDQVPYQPQQKHFNENRNDNRNDHRNFYDNNRRDDNRRDHRNQDQQGHNRDQQGHNNNRDHNRDHQGHNNRDQQGHNNNRDQQGYNNREPPREKQEQFKQRREDKNQDYQNKQGMKNSADRVLYVPKKHDDENKQKFEKSFKTVGFDFKDTGSDDEKLSETMDPAEYWEFVNKKYGQPLSQQNSESPNLSQNDDIKYHFNLTSSGDRTPPDHGHSNQSNAQNLPPQLRDMFLQPTQTQNPFVQQQNAERRVTIQVPESRGEEKDGTGNLNPNKDTELNWQQKELLSKRTPRFDKPGKSHRGGGGHHKNFENRDRQVGESHGRGGGQGGDNSKPMRIPGEGGRGRGRGGKSWHQKNQGQQYSKSM